MIEKLPFFLVLLLLVGCNQDSSNLKLVTVSGEVAYQGEPVVDGVIRLVPVNGSSAPVRTAVISDGKYEFSGKSAVGIGTFQVEITAFRGEDVLPLDLKEGEVGREQYLPEQFNRKTTIDEFTVKSGDTEMRKDFIFD